MSAERSAATEREIVILARPDENAQWVVIAEATEDEALAAGWDVRHAMLYEGDRVHA